MMMTHGDVCVRLGQRMECYGYYGTICYVGEVPPTKGVWLGVDWDDSTRGKHNGTHEGKKYFSTRNPTSGSFVRLEKVNFGKSCPVALRNRYGEIKDDETAGINKENLALLQREMNARFLEVVGFDKVNKKQSQFQQLEVVWLREHFVNGAGEDGELQSLCPNIREIDLSKNLIGSWQDLADLTKQLRHLRVMNVSENCLQIPARPLDYQAPFSSLVHLVMGRMEYFWTEVLDCALMWPQIEKLQVPFNRITTLETPPDGILYQLQFLDLEGNCIYDWREINKLGTLPCLQYLNASNTGVSEVSLPDSKLFSSLKQLHISENNIHSWESVSQLDKLQNLEELRFRDSPVLLQESVETTRQLIIARIGKLKVLNGVVITNEERKGAEIDYLKKYGVIWVNVAKPLEAVYHNSILQVFIGSHPRYPQLVDKYGAPDEAEYKVKEVTLNTNLITVEIFNPDLECKTYKKKLPRSMQVQKLLGLVQKLFNTGAEVPKLSYISSKNPDIEFPLDKELKELSYFSVEDGDRISVRW